MNTVQHWKNKRDWTINVREKNILLKLVFTLCLMPKNPCMTYTMIIVKAWMLDPLHQGDPLDLFCTVGMALVHLSLWKAVSVQINLRLF